MVKSKKMFSTYAIIKEALLRNQNADLNELHEITFKVMLEIRDRYYQQKVEEFINSINSEVITKEELRKRLLKPVTIKGIEYSNFMEATSRPVSQTFQVISGNLAEKVMEREFESARLFKNKHYTHRKGRTDFIVYHPNIQNPKAQHRIEVKNVKLRERGTRGLIFDGDSLVGFFNDSKEFTKSTIEIIDRYCSKTRGYCYIPPTTLKALPLKGKRLKSNT